MTNDTDTDVTPTPAQQLEQLPIDIGEQRIGWTMYGDDVHTLNDMERAVRDYRGDIPDAVDKHHNRAQAALTRKRDHLSKLDKGLGQPLAVSSTSRQLLHQQEYLQKLEADVQATHLRIKQLETDLAAKQLTHGTRTDEVLRGMQVDLERHIDAWRFAMEKVLDERDEILNEAARNRSR